MLESQERLRVSIRPYLEIGGAPLSFGMLSVVNGPIVIVDPKAREITPKILKFLRKREFNSLFDFLLGLNIYDLNESH
ncbi:MAG: hypothetical protein ACPLRN_01595, partial [Microgenomates group bacterium]